MVTDGSIDDTSAVAADAALSLSRRWEARRSGKGVGGGGGKGGGRGTNIGKTTKKGRMVMTEGWALEGRDDVVTAARTPFKGQAVQARKTER